MDLVLTPTTDPQAWRDQLLATVKPEAELVVRLEGEFRFTAARQLITILNTVAWDRQCTLRYADEKQANPPPLAIRYSHEPNITKARAVV